MEILCAIYRSLVSIIPCISISADSVNSNNTFQQCHLPTSFECRNQKDTASPWLECTYGWRARQDCQRHRRQTHKAHANECKRRPFSVFEQFILYALCTNVYFCHFQHSNFQLSNDFVYDTFMNKSIKMTIF